MAKRLRRFLWSMCLVLPLSLNAVQGTTEEIKSLTIHLPINELDEKAFVLRVNVPEGYETLQELPSKYMEFIPKGEDPYKWSQILTLQSLVGSKVTASAFLSEVKDGMKKAAPSFTLIEENVKERRDYQVATFGATYTSPLGRDEIVYMRYYSGPADLSGIQVARPLKATPAPEVQLKQLIEFIDQVSAVEPKTF